ncbi:hypothetical protein HDU91_005936 [Kappamyces sp. JEL0680]|nr:hypothetical protein HDU91_005936 [Kappamyces sp. JEL0680]
MSQTCSDCNTALPFGVFRRGTPCGGDSCSKVLCGSCADYALVLPSQSQIAALCKACFKKHNALDFGTNVELVGRPKGTAQCIVWVHGGGGCRKMFRVHADKLADRYTHILLDLPGHGSRMDEPLSLASAIDCIVQTTRDHAVEWEGKKPVYVGGSLGGYIGMELLGSHHIFSKAIICMAGQDVGKGRGWAAGLGLLAMNATIPLVGATTMLSGMASQARSNGHISEELLMDIALRTGMFFHQGKQQVAILQNSDPRSALPLYPGQILFINGAKDHRDSEQVWVKCSQHARLIVYEGADHFFSHDDRFLQRFVDDLQAFVSEENAAVILKYLGLCHTVTPSTQRQLYFVFIRLLDLDLAGTQNLLFILRLLSLVGWKENQLELKPRLVRHEARLHSDLHKTLSFIWEEIKKIEKGFGKKQSLQLDADLVREMVESLACITRMWPSSTCEHFWKGRATAALTAGGSPMSSILFLYQAISQTDSRRIKEPLLEMLSDILEHEYWAVLSNADASKETVQTLLHRLCDWIVFLLEESSATGKVVCYDDAPLLVDFEVYFGLTRTMKSIKAMLQARDAASEDDLARLDYVVMSIDNIIDFSGNTQLQLDQAENREALKSTAVDAGSAPVPQDQNYETALLVSQVHDLFPELGDGFIEILEDSLPPHLAKLDRSLPSRNTPAQAVSRALVRVSSVDSMATVGSREMSDATEEPGANSLQDRLNVFDGDKFDVFSGKHVDTNYDRERAEFLREQKQAIIASQLEDDDEYDDTYDTTDIKLSGHYAVAEDPDPTPGNAEQPKIDTTEKHLVHLYTETPSIFHPSARKSKERDGLRAKLQWTDEQIEGWFIMLNRNVCLVAV